VGTPALQFFTNPIHLSCHLLGNDLVVLAIDSRYKECLVEIYQHYLRVPEENQLISA